MSLETGKRIHRFKCTMLPFTQESVDRVEELGENKNNEDDVAFTDGNGNVM